MTDSNRIDSSFTVTSGALCFGTLSNILQGAQAPIQSPPTPSPCLTGTVVAHQFEHNVPAKNGTWKVYKLRDIDSPRVDGWFAAHQEVDPLPELTKILSWYICLLSKRDDVLVARSAYSVVREFLLEINELIVHHQRDINVYDYIQEYTNLARSTIIKILSDLKKGQYIVIDKGRLINMTALPEKY